MAYSIRSPKNLGAGVLYIAIGGAAALLSQSFSIGTPMRMGAGFMPTILGACLILVGVISVLRGVTSPGEAMEPMSWRPVAFVLGALLAFAVLLPGAGLLISLAALLAIAPLGSRFVRYSPIGIALALALIAFCAAVFVQGLGLPMPLFGSWFRN